MPIYEYRCQDCGKRSSVLTLRVTSETTPTCRSCGGPRLERLLSKFASPKSEEARLEALADPSQYGDIDENDPQSMARFMKKMGHEMGEDFGDDVDAVMEDAGNEGGESDTTGML